MAYDLKLAGTCTQFTLVENNLTSISTKEEKAALFNALLKNNNVLKVNVPDDVFDSTQKKILAMHIIRNIQALFEHTDIRVHYTEKNENKSISTYKKDFRFDDPGFYNAKNIFFTRFEFKEPIKEPDFKLAILKSFMLTELQKCPNLKKCHFYVQNTHPTEPFLNNTQKQALKNKNCSVSQVNRSKYQSHWALFTGLALGMPLLIGAFVALPLWGLKSFLCFSMASSFFFFLAGSIDSLRQRFLFNVGNQHIQDLREGNTPSDQAIVNSLIAGEQSKYWGGYLRSYLNFKTYSPKNYGAYTAGLYIGVNDLKVPKKAIENLRLR